jgi:hypothetical protein
MMLAFFMGCNLPYRIFGVIELAASTEQSVSFRGLSIFIE